MSDKTYIDGAESTAEHTAAGSTLATLQSTATAVKADILATLQTKLQQLQAKLHKEFRWYCDTILQGGSLAVRIAYRVHCAVETIEMVDKGEVRDDPALGSYCILIGGSLYSEDDVDRLLETEYLLDDLYDAWCKMSHSDTEWSDMVDMYLDDTVTRERR